MISSEITDIQNAEWNRRLSDVIWNRMRALTELHVTGGGDLEMGERRKAWHRIRAQTCHIRTENRLYLLPAAVSTLVLHMQRIHYLELTY